MKQAQQLRVLRRYICGMEPAYHCQGYFMTFKAFSKSQWKIKGRNIFFAFSSPRNQWNPKRTNSLKWRGCMGLVREGHHLMWDCRKFEATGRQWQHLSLWRKKGAKNQGVVTEEAAAREGAPSALSTLTASATAFSSTLSLNSSSALYHRMEICLPVLHQPTNWKPNHESSSEQNAKKPDMWEYGCWQQGSKPFSLRFLSSTYASPPTPNVISGNGEVWGYLRDSAFPSTL